MNLRLSYLVLSDIHFGNNLNPTENIVNNLLKYFKDNHKVFSKLKIIFIAGDIFDKLLTSGSKNHNLVMQWLTTLAVYCKHNNIKLRILEGTPSHDWKQASTINVMLKESKLDLDFKYIDVLSIETMDDLGLNILYVPDEWKHKASDTFKDIQNLLLEKNMTQVDIAIMHGQFHYQLPIKMLESSHDENDFLNIVKHYISIGHIHSHSVNGRILAQGSFDRISHNEEESKGGMVITIDEYSGNSFLFIPNKNAKIFKTIKINETEMDKYVSVLKPLIDKYPLGSHIRLTFSKDNSIRKNIKNIQDLFKGYTIKEHVPDKDKKKDDTELDVFEETPIEGLKITRDNIEDLVHNELSKYTLSPDIMENINSELKMAL